MRGRGASGGGRRRAWALALGLVAGARPQEGEEPRAWEAFELDQLARERERTGRAYLSFLERPSLSAGLYELAAGAEDRQTPHERDEVYHVLAGRARLVVGGDDVPVRPGSVVYVAAGVEHRFHAIEEDLRVLVMFAAAPPVK